MILRPPLVLAAALFLAPVVLCAESAPGAKATPPGAEPPETVVECTGLAETVSSDTETVATFQDNVVVTGNGIRLTCDRLRVVATRKGDPTATLGKYGRFKSLVATGHVRILQTDREADCGQAEVFPFEDRIVLSDHPVVRIPAENYEATGPRMVLYRGQRRAVIEGNDHQRARIVLPPIKDLGFGPDKAEAPAPTPAPAPGP